MVRVGEDLNRALHALVAEDPRVYVLGEDIADPYGGAFKITKGLTTRFPERVLTTPISEAGFTGVASGLALCGDKVIVEVMFADFLSLAFDQIVNFAAKSVSMYGEPTPIRMVVRCPAGGQRGYGPTHSQSPQKHFIGVPHLSIYELSPFHANAEVLATMLATGHPCLFVEDKSLYAQRQYDASTVDDLFSYDYVDPERNYARVFMNTPEAADNLILAPGGLFHRALSATRRLFLETERLCQIVVPSRLYPFDVRPLRPLLDRIPLVYVVEESTAGGTWGAEVAVRIYDEMWGRLRHPVRLIHSRDSVIPTASHLERQVIVQDSDIFQALQREP